MKLITKPRILSDINKLMRDAEEKNQDIEALVLTPNENAQLMVALGAYEYVTDRSCRYVATEKATGRLVSFYSRFKYRGVPVFCVSPDLYDLSK